MPNTGKKIVLTLKHENQTDQTTDGSKDNVVGDFDYIAPYIDPVDCPIVFDMTCPSPILFNTTGNQFWFEFRLPKSTTENPAIKNIRVLLMQGGVQQSYINFSPPFKNYFSGYFTPTKGAIYSLVVQYLATDLSVVHDCGTVLTTQY